jgi:hypothetical protein
VRVPTRLSAALLVVLLAAAAAVALGAGDGRSTPRSSGAGGLCAPAPGPPDNGAHGRKLYVSPSGSASAPGTLKQPMRWLQTALNRVQPGDTVYLRGGTYSGYYYLGRDGTAEKPIVIRGYPGEEAVIAGRFRIDASHLVVSHLVFDQTGSGVHDVSIYMYTGDDDWIAYNEIRHSGYSGILVDSGAERLKIVGNWIHDNGSNIRWDHGVYWSGGQVGLLAQNVIDHNVGYGVQLYPNADQIVVQRNTVVRNGRSGIIVGGDSSNTSDSDLIVGNIVALNGQQGIRTFWERPVGVDNVARDNLSYRNATGGVVGGDGLAASATVDANPRFASASNGDFRVGVAALARRFGSELDVGCVVRGRAAG